MNPGTQNNGFSRSISDILPAISAVHAAFRYGSATPVVAMSNVILLAFCLVLTTPINAQGPEIEVWAAPTHVKAAQIFTVHIKARSASPFSVDARIHLPPRCYAVQGLRGDSLSIHEENLRADKPHEWAAVINSETTDPGGLKTVAVDVNGQTYHVTVYVEAILQTRIQSQTPSPTNTHTSNLSGNGLKTKAAWLKNNYCRL